MPDPHQMHHPEAAASLHPTLYHSSGRASDPDSAKINNRGPCCLAARPWHIAEQSPQTAEKTRSHMQQKHMAKAPGAFKPPHGGCHHVVQC